MNPMIQVDVFCLRKLPSDVKGYTVDVFNKNTDYCTSSAIPWASTYRAKCVQK